MDPYPAENASTIPWFKRANPDGHWSMPFVTHKKYYARWLYGLDFTHLSVLVDPGLWQPADGSIELVLPFYEEREAIDFTSDVAGLHANMTLSNTVLESNWLMGMNDVFDDVETREMHFVLNGRDGTTNLAI